MDADGDVTLLWQEPPTFWGRYGPYAARRYFRGMSDSPAIPSEPRDFTVFTTSWCPFCQRLTKLLGERGIPFTEVDVEEDAAAAAFVESVNNGNRVVPTVLYSDGSTQTNPGASQVAATVDALAAASQGD